MRSKLKITICGAGNTGHLAAVLFSQKTDLEVVLYSIRSEINLFHKDNVEPIRAILKDGTILESKNVLMTNIASEAFQDVDIVIITTPIHLRETTLQKMLPVLSRTRKVFVGAIPGFGGFNWLAEKILFDLPNVVIWGLKDVPHIAFDLIPSKSIKLGGSKSHIYVAMHRRETVESAEMLLMYLRRIYDAKVTLLTNYLEITLTPGNPIMHSAVIYSWIGPWGQWYGRYFDYIPCWWSECPELGAYFLARCDDENQRLCREIEKLLNIDLSSIQSLQQEIIEGYGNLISDSRTLLSTLRTNKAYDNIYLPLIQIDENSLKYEFNKQHRVFYEDIACGLNLLVTLAEHLDVPTPYMKEIYLWCIEYMGIEHVPPFIPDQL